MGSGDGSVVWDVVSGDEVGLDGEVDSGGAVESDGEVDPGGAVESDGEVDSGDGVDADSGAGVDELSDSGDDDGSRVACDSASGEDPTASSDSPRGDGSTASSSGPRDGGASGTGELGGEEPSDSAVLEGRESSNSVVFGGGGTRGPSRMVRSGLSLCWGVGLSLAGGVVWVDGCGVGSGLGAGGGVVVGGVVAGGWGWVGGGVWSRRVLSLEVLLVLVLVLGWFDGPLGVLLVVVLVGVAAGLVAPTGVGWAPVGMPLVPSRVLTFVVAKVGIDPLGAMVGVPRPMRLPKQAEVSGCAAGITDAAVFTNEPFPRATDGPLKIGLLQVLGPTGTQQQRTHLLLDISPAHVRVESELGQHRPVVAQPAPDPTQDRHPERAGTKRQRGPTQPRTHHRRGQTAKSYSDSP